MRHTRLTCSLSRSPVTPVSPVTPALFPNPLSHPSHLLSFSIPCLTRVNRLTRHNVSLLWTLVQSILLTLVQSILL
jgi:hypothetical protein